MARRSIAFVVLLLANAQAPARSEPRVPRVEGSERGSARVEGSQLTPTRVDRQPARDAPQARTGTGAISGVVIGSLLAHGAGRYVEAQLFGLAPTDAPTVLLAVSVMLLVAAAAGYLPARRASRVDPMVALRVE